MREFIMLGSSSTSSPTCYRWYIRARFCDTLHLDPETKWGSFCDDVGTVKLHQFLGVGVTDLLHILQYIQDKIQDIKYQR